MATVAFRQMRDGTKSEYELLHELERQYIPALRCGSSMPCAPLTTGSRATW
jgi:hypothetical protein